jgi:ubiquinol-cytochrome c reductase cytochrome b subunit
MRRLRDGLDWLEERTGYRTLLRTALYERIPGGARWRYVWGSTLAFAIFVQFVTGVVLWAGYSANAQGAWESVYFIQYQMAGGWLVRGIHHYTTQVMVVLLVLHLMQVLVDGAYRAPREVTFWFGLALLFVVLGLGLTGYLLPWDQKGYWATKVATSIASMTPFVGVGLQQALVGGSEYGHHTLTRFFALHAGVLPATLVLLLVGHVYLFRRFGVTVREPVPENAKDAHFWPEQVLRDGVAALAVMAAVLALVLWTGGAHLGAPADPTEPYAAARPDWYFMFLFQWLKYFPAGWEVVGAQIVPGLLVGLVAAMPIVGRWRLGHRFNLGVAASLLVGVGLLTRAAYVEDAADPGFVAAKAQAETVAERVRVLAGAPAGIPASGALSLVRADPLTQGPRLFAANRASCHRYQGHDGLGTVPSDDQSAPDLAGFGTREWIRGLMDPERIATSSYFGATEHRLGRMARFVQRGLAGFGPEDRERLDLALVAVSAEAQLPRQAAADSAQMGLIEAGRALIRDGTVECARCHVFHEMTEGDGGPVLTGWGSREWMLGMVHDPSAEAYYGSNNDRMPSFGAEERLTREQIGLIVDWLREDWYEPEAGGR